jgi:hypothetical protein
MRLQDDELRWGAVRDIGRSKTVGVDALAGVAAAADAHALIRHPATEIIMRQNRESMAQGRDL